MTNPRDTASKSDLTGHHLLETSLRLFRRKGFERTTMRDIAEAAGMSVGAAYYHFQSKEDLVLAYYRFSQDEHERLLRERLPGVTDTAERIRIALRSKLELIAPGRAYLGALFRFAGDPAHPLSVFGPATAEIRRRAIATFALALEGSGLQGEAARLAETGLWALHLALILHAVHDRSPGMTKTYALADTAATILGQMTTLVQTPSAAPIVAWLATALGAIGGQPDDHAGESTNKHAPKPANKRVGQLMSNTRSKGARAKITKITKITKIRRKP